MATGAIIQYRPGYFSGFDEDHATEFSNLDELSRIEFVKVWQELPKFYRFSVSPHSDKEGYEYHLLAEFDEGYRWFVVGFLNKSDLLKDLPVFEEKYRDKAPMTFTRHIVIDMDETMVQHCILCGEIISDYRNTMSPAGQRASRGYAAGEVYVSNTKNPKISFTERPKDVEIRHCQ